MRFLVVFTLFYLSLLPCFGQGNAGVLATERNIAWVEEPALFSFHPAALAGDTLHHVAIGLGNTFLLPEFSTLFLSGSRVLGKGHTLGMGLKHMGWKGYFESVITMGYAMRLAKTWRLGLNLNHHLVGIQGLGLRYRPSVDFGSHYLFHKQWMVSAVIRNLSATPLNKDARSKLTFQSAVGITYKPLPTVQTRINVAFTYPHFISFGTAWLYTWNKKMTLGLSAAAIPLQLGLSFDMQIKNTRFAFAVAYTNGISWSSSGYGQWTY